MENILEINGHCKTYDDFSLQDVSFSLPRGFIMGFVGENGSGKTTTIRSILNMAKIDEQHLLPYSRNSESKSHRCDC